MKNWYTIENRAKGVIDISLHDEIGRFGITAADFVRNLKEQGDVTSINLSIHSPGGSAFDGIAIYNVLLDHPAKVYANVLGIAASAASFILMAADVISMPEDSFLMIHNAQGGAIGDASTMRGVAESLEMVTNTIINIYEKRTGYDRELIAEMMNVETLMTASDALEFGFTDNVTEPLGLAAKIYEFRDYFKELPFENPVKLEPEKVETITDFEKCLRDAGISKKLATALTSRAKVVFQCDTDEAELELKKIVERLDNLKLPDLN
jgi:ATP-dependent Clp endopeptidase proteolytic subunit ClpP